MGFLLWRNRWHSVRARIHTRLIQGEFGAIGAGTLIFPPFNSADVTGVYIGGGCCIHGEGWIETVREYAGVAHRPRIEIGDGTSIGYRAHIIGCDRIRIGRQVLIASNVYITDNLHGYRDVARSVIEQGLVVPGPVMIDDEAWIGENVCVLPNVTIGRHAVIGSNAVVTRDVPPYCVAVGIPAKVIRRYDPGTQKWERVCTDESPALPVAPMIRGVGLPKKPVLSKTSLNGG